MKKVLFLANIPTKDSRSIGGATVLAKNILDFLNEQKEITTTHSSIRKNWRKFGQIKDYFLWIFKAPFQFYKHDIISIHATNDFHFTIAPIIWVWAKLLNKKITYHFFGGIFYELYVNKNVIHKYIIKNTILKSDTLFMETKMMIDNFNKINIKNCIWLPNSRKKSKYRTNTNYNQKFVFISRVTPTKGVDEIIKISKKLPKNYQIHIYGPLDKNYYSVEKLTNSNLKYKGVIEAKDVSSILSQYDMLLLPTFYNGEGYPGIIIEGLSVGVPVITTKWRCLNEIVTNNYNGILITPQNTNELQNAVLEVNNESYKKMNKNALISFNMFSNERVFNKILTAYLIE